MLNSSYFRNKLFSNSFNDGTQEKPIVKKRKYEEAFGYPNDYLVVQEPEYKINRGFNWIDAYLEGLQSNER